MPGTGGVSIAVSEAIEELYPDKIKYFKSKKAEGVKECKEILDKALSGNLDATFIEGMGCVGGCVGGPKILVPASDAKKQLINLLMMLQLKLLFIAKFLMMF